MADRDMNQENRVDSGRSSVAIAERKRPVSDIVAGKGGENDKRMQGGSEPRSERGGFFDVYKPTQGQNIRIWSGVAMGSLACWFAYFVFDKMKPLFTGAMHTVVPFAAAAVIVAALGLLGYWVLGLNRRACDFLIATEGEMKKVNWTTRKEIYGSTKVVIFVVVSMSILLFVVDIAFMLFFSAIGVLKAQGLFETLFGK